MCAPFLCGSQFNASRQCSRLLVVCSHCVLDVRNVSVIVWWLVAIWTKVVHVVYAFFFFFSQRACTFYVYDSVLASLCGCCTSVCFGYDHVFCFVFGIVALSICAPDR